MNTSHSNIKPRERSVVLVNVSLIPFCAAKQSSYQATADFEGSVSFAVSNINKVGSLQQDTRNMIVKGVASWLTLMLPFNCLATKGNFTQVLL